jgi:diguanylate cyclase (GGDEF)-like protein
MDKNNRSRADYSARWRFFCQLCLCCCLLAVAPVVAQEKANVRFSSLAEEFPNAPVTSFAVAQDQQGFIWLANQLDGLLRFDGYQLEQFQLLQPSGAEELSISTVQVDPQNRLWIGTWGYGLLMLAGDRQQQQHWQLAGTLAQPANGQSGSLDQIQHIYHDRQQRLWIGTTAGVYWLDSQLQRQPLPDSLKAQLEHIRIWKIDQSKDGNLWFATSRGLVQVSADLSSHKLWSLQDVDYPGKTSRYLEIRAILPVGDNVWLASSDGLFLLDLSAQRIQPLPHHQQKLTRINKLSSGADGQLLIGSSDGLYQLKAPFSYRQQLDKLLHAVDVRDVLTDQTGLIWLSTRNRGVFTLSMRQDKFNLLTDRQHQSHFEQGLHRIASQYLHQGTLWLGLEQQVLSFQLQSRQWQQHSFPADSQVSLVTGLTVDPSGQTWATTNVGLFRLDGKKGFINENRPFSALDDSVDISLMSLSHSPDGTLNIGSWQHGLIRWQPTTPEQPGRQYAIAKHPSDWIQQSAVAPDGMLWLVSPNSGLYRFDPTDESIEHYSTADNSAVVLPSNSLPCVTAVATDEIWLCSDKGLIKLDPQRQTLTRWTTADGLPDQRVIAVTVDNAGSIWLSTRRGLAQLQLQPPHIRSFVEQDGIPSLLLEPRALTADQNGRFFIGTGRGVLSFEPRQLQPVAKTAPLVFTSIQLDQQRWWQQHSSATKPLLIPANHKQFTVQFSLLDFAHSQHHQYRYRLRGLDDAWSHQAHQNSASFHHLPAGLYQLEIEVMSASNPPPPLQLFLKVARPWWMYKLVWFFAALCLLVLVALLIRFRLRRLQVIATRLNAQVATRTAELAAANQQLALQVRTDFLTRLPNRLAFTEQYQLIQRQRSRHATPLALAMIDIDFFKKINDNFGHEAGDLVLSTVATTLQQRLRKQDVLARFGGEEFVLLLPNTNASGAISICQMLRLAVAEQQIHYQQQLLSVTATFGVVELELRPELLSYWQNAADEALYYGKKQGRNQVVLYSDLPRQP